MTIWPFLNSVCCIVLHKSRRCELVMYLKKWMPLLNFVICSICSSVRSSGGDSRADWHLCHALEAPVFSANSHKSALKLLYVVNNKGSDFPQVLLCLGRRHVDHIRVATHKAQRRVHVAARERGDEHLVGNLDAGLLHLRVRWQRWQTFSQSGP